MGLEIEKKYLVKDNSWKQQAEGVHYRQGYLSSNSERTVRVRTLENTAYLTIKGISKGATRLEFEYEIPYQEAIELLNELCEKPIIEKTRYKVLYKGVLWEIDEFAGENQGLVMAEVELSSEEQLIELPPWIDAEVTTDKKYYNSNLIKHPYTQWK